ncbi:MAG: NUDIX hydrolase [Bacteroidetes bacterium]|nr:NUDIX hydrolase [Bacteroidota bacterium]
MHQPKGQFTYDYPRPMVTCDAAVFSQKDHKEWHILLIERKNDPFKYHWALPGGFIEMEETLEQTALRELKEETGIHEVGLEPFWTYGDPGRDPRGRVITVVFIGRIDWEHAMEQTHAGDDAANARWFPFSKLPVLAFDHREIIDHLLSEFPFSSDHL